MSVSKIARALSGNLDVSLFCKAAAKKFVIDLHRMVALFHFVLANYCSGTRSRRDDLIG